MRKSYKLFCQKVDASCPVYRSQRDICSRRLRSILDIRKSPRQVHRLGVQSQMLATLPIVQKTQEKEVEWRKRALERSSKNASTSVEMRCASLRQSEPSGAHQTTPKSSDVSYYAIMASGTCGLVMGFYVIDYIFEDPSGVRLLYDPHVGFLSTIEQCEANIHAYSELLSDSVDSHLERARAE